MVQSFFPPQSMDSSALGCMVLSFVRERKICDNDGDDDESDFQDFLNTDHLATGPLTICLTQIYRSTNSLFLPPNIFALEDFLYHSCIP